MESGRYTAFLSYSHRDAREAGWLHRRLEAYRIPRRLAGSGGERGPVPARLAPIFRDREELPAAGDLSEQVRAALARSDTLVVVCSPNSAESPWVAKEVAAFRELHPDRPILAAIVAGEPPHCFPGGLAEGGAEPLAADLRPGRDGRRLGFLKLVAGLAGVGVDALVQRDAQRRVRRVTAVTAAALAAMLVMAIMTTLALNARAEAQRQRAEAEGLVEFMLTDLRDRLRGVGRVEIMQAVNARALSRYAKGEDLSELTEEALARRARVLHAIAEDELTLGRTDNALAAYREARRTTGEQLERERDDSERLLRHARSEYGIGRVHELRGEWPLAQHHYLQFADLAKRLVRLDPREADHLVAAGSSAINLGNVELNGNREASRAQRHYHQAVKWFAQAGRARRGDVTIQLSEANALGWLADSYFAQSLWRRSLEARRRQAAIMERLHIVDPDNLDTAYRFALSQRALAVGYTKVEDSPSARTYLFSAYDWARRLSARDPDNAEWALFRAFVACNLLYMNLGFPEGSSRAGLRAQVRSVVRKLEAARNPRVDELARCLDAIKADEGATNIAGETT